MQKPIVLLCLFLTLASFGTAQHNTYYVGHSGFGWELIVGEMVNDLATDAGINSYDYGYQFIGGTCLSSQWLNHASPTVGTDSHVELATGNYDALILLEQIPIDEVVYSSPWGCDLTSVQAVDSFTDLATAANPNIRLYMAEYHNEIDQTALDPYIQWTGTNAAMRVLHEQVADSISLINGGQPICLVPVAKAYQSMVDSVRAGVFPGVTDWLDLFAANDPDNATFHPTEETFYLAACVHFATLFGVSPVGLTHQTFAVAGWQFDPPTPAQAAMMQEIAWEVVSNDPRACMPVLSGQSEPSSYLDYGFSLHQDLDGISFEFEGKDFEQLEIYDLAGRIRFQTQVDNRKIRIAKSTLGSGLLMYRLTGKEAAAWGKLVR